MNESIYGLANYAYLRSLWYEETHPLMPILDNEYQLSNKSLDILQKISFPISEALFINTTFSFDGFDKQYTSIEIDGNLYFIIGKHYYEPIRRLFNFVAIEVVSDHICIVPEKEHIHLHEHLSQFVNESLLKFLIFLSIHRKYGCLLYNLRQVYYRHNGFKPQSESETEAISQVINIEFSMIYTLMERHFSSIDKIAISKEGSYWYEKLLSWKMA